MKSLNELVCVISANGLPMWVDSRICGALGLKFDEKSPFLTVEEVIAAYECLPTPSQEEITVTIHPDHMNGQPWIEAVAPGDLRCSVEDPACLGDTWEAQQAAMREWLITLVVHRRSNLAAKARRSSLCA